MRISDWSSDVCSSDLLRLYPVHRGVRILGTHRRCQLRRECQRVTTGAHRERYETLRMLAQWQQVDRAQRVVSIVQMECPDHSDHRITLGGVRLRIHQQRSEEHTSELQSLMRISYAVFCLKKKNA